jgi:hypothetical protein
MITNMHETAATQSRARRTPLNEATAERAPRFELSPLEGNRHGRLHLDFGIL